MIWQQRKTAHEAERTYLLSLAESAANEVIRLSYELQDHFGRVPHDPNSDAFTTWRARLGELTNALEEQALRFHDDQVREFLARCHMEMRIQPVWLDDPDWWRLPRYFTICKNTRAVMGSVLRRQPFPVEIMESHPGPP
ncbi:hypothetical protein [Streptomyces sp. enrichment culture]|uniref:hypothetical protein n=1 Tax=Streptomyces sp. enrichment culture TaxID=1795815 RepID=UPI003F5443F4